MRNMEFKIEISPEKENPNLVRVEVVNEENEFCCESMLDLYKSSYGRPLDKPDQTQTFIYGGLNFIPLETLEVPEEDDEPSVDLTFIFEVERKRRFIGFKKKREYMGYAINYCPFCGEPITVREIQCVLSNEKEETNKRVNKTR